MYQLFKPPGQLGQWIVAVTACACSLTSGQIFSWPSAALPKIINGQAGFNLTITEQSSVVSVTYLGNLISPIPAGYIMDMIGRKNTLLVSDLLLISSWVIIYLGNTSWSLFVARLLAGLWMGVFFTVVPALLGEVADANIRGSAVSLFGLMIYIGALYESVIIFADYRILSIVSSIPSILLFVALLFLPESPYFHLMKSNKDAARKSIVWLRGKCLDEDLDRIDLAVQEQMSNKTSFKQIIETRETRKAFYITQALNMVQRLCGRVFIFSYITILLPDSWISPGQCFIIFCIAGLCTNSFVSCIFDKFERRTFMFISCAGITFSMLGLTIWYYLDQRTNIDMATTKWLPHLFTIVYNMSYAAGIITIPVLLTGELFPVNIKGKVSAITTITCAFTSWISVRLYQPFHEYVGDYANFLVGTIVGLIGIILTAIYFIETKGRTLEEIQEDLKCFKLKNVHPNLNSGGINQS